MNYLPNENEQPTIAVDTFPLTCRVNGREVKCDVEVDRSLLNFLRDDLGLTGTKGSCLEGECGSCTVLLDGKPINSCMTLACQAQGREVLTIEGIADRAKLNVLQQQFVKTGAAQCGYCSPGLIMAAAGMIEADPDLTEEQLLTGIEGNICRCTGYNAIVEAVREAHREITSAESGGEKHD